MTLDLGGHRLIGSGSGVGVQISPDSVGGNTVRNGTIKNWRIGISFEDGATDPVVPHQVTDVELRSAPYEGLPSTQITRLTAVDSSVSGGFGVFAISQSKLTRSPINLFRATLTITDSILVQSPFSDVLESTIMIDSSRLDGNGVSAFGIFSESPLTITDSVVKNFQTPITGYWGSVTLTKNKFTDMPNGVLGDISSRGAFGYSVSHIVGNTFTRSGVVLRGEVPMVVENNTFTQNTVGVEFTIPPPLDPTDPPPTATLSRAVGNTFTKNSGSGLKTELAGLEVGGNTAKKNGGYGIYAPGAFDLGGNIASGNVLGDCVGVACTSK
ncbi:right-handed parallel beta-helix repeat-containing protein [Micromonospora sp. DT81.3]|uniref:right-handed parallel beta-helix repeat-containing protein n=1 Tax=Micromonospora sp. DT81.3 TaxID=3416523 RepID=UPI003CF7E086